MTENKSGEVLNRNRVAQNHSLGGNLGAGGNEIFEIENRQRGTGVLNKPDLL